jgi:hypothetical protein
MLTDCKIPGESGPHTDQLRKESFHAGLTNGVPPVPYVTNLW